MRYLTGTVFVFLLLVSRSFAEVPDKYLTPLSFTGADLAALRSEIELKDIARLFLRGEPDPVSDFPVAWSLRHTVAFLPFQRVFTAPVNLDERYSRLVPSEKKAALHKILNLVFHTLKSHIPELQRRDVEIDFFVNDALAAYFKNEQLEMLKPDDE